MNKTIFLTITICFLAGCSVLPSTPPESIKVKVPVQTKCLGELPAKPSLITDAQLQALPPDDFVTALHVDRLQRDVYELGLEAAIEGCK